MKPKLVLIAILALTVSLFPIRSAFSQQKQRTDIDTGFKQDINKAVQDAVKLLKKLLPKSAQIGYNSLGAYALLAAGVKENDPSVQKVIKEILAKFDAQGNYKAGGVPVYVAGVDLMALEKTKNPQYLPQIQTIANFLINDIDSDGGFWTYPNTQSEGGDTSQSQYALLGLWAAKKAGAYVPAHIWRKSAKWHVDTQASSGSFFYHPSRSEVARHTMGVAGTGSLIICKNLLAGIVHLSGSPRKKEKISKNDRKFRGLKKLKTGKTEEELEKEKELERQRNKAANASGGGSQTSAAIGKGISWFNANFRIVNTRRPMYYIYSIERLGALSGKQIFGGTDWYKKGAEHLIATQKSDGQWVGQCGTIADTSYGILFLVRATGGFNSINYLGDGRQRGNAIGVDFSKPFTIDGDGKPKYTKKPGPIEKLLTVLQDIDLSDEAIKNSIPDIVEQIKFNPKEKEKLLKNSKLLHQLLQHKKWEVRQVAVWALGKTGTIENASKLIAALDDRNTSVQREAHLALCFLSRNPLGPADKYGKHLSEGPGSDLPENATDAVKKTTEMTWQKEAKARWDAWYFRIRPYEQRDDLRDSAEKEKQKRMKGGKKK